ncbi:MAG TPA: prolyl oligopeptidase family serine peptidase [Gemmatimonadales bacterium]|nr:prolyl oligopeptidase family serine peptidase [Gemmatimonadales bacterium]
MSSRQSLVRLVGSLSCALLCATADVLTAQAPARLQEPLPLDVAQSLRSINRRSSFYLSPDGQWLAHTILTDETVPRDTLAVMFTATGMPFGEGDARMEATLTHTRTGEVIRLGSTTSSSWAPVWSPDGKRVAFYSDEGGEAGIWIWDMATRRATRFPGVIARHFFGFEQIRWSQDGQRLLAPILPAGMTVAQANALTPTGKGPGERFPKVGPDQPAVLVRRAEARAPGAPRDTAATGSAPAERRAPEGNNAHLLRDLALLDLRTRQVTRVVERTPVQYFAFAPDERSIAYTVHKGWEAASQQPNYDLVVQELGSGTRRTLVTNARMGYGIEWRWAPDGRSLAYIESGLSSSGEIVVVPVRGGAPRSLARAGLPKFRDDEGELAPLWSTDSRSLFAVGDGKLWRLDVVSGQGTAVGAIPGWEVTVPATGFGRNTIWSSDGGRTVWVLARSATEGKSGLFAVDVASGRTRPALQEAKVYSGLFTVDASSATGEIAFVSSGQQHPHDAWAFNTKTSKTRQVTHTNPALERYELGRTRLIEWTDAEGRRLRGALLLPPGYQPGRRLPLVALVYGGQMGSENLNRFGLWSELPVFNAQLFATRGFAVLTPDIPVRTGQTAADIVQAVSAAVDAAIAQGYADPEKLAVMGQSYGSFTTLSVITHADRFKAAVITAAVLHPDLFTDYLRNTGYYEQGQGNMGGTIWEHPDRYQANSPLFRFDRITTPLLIGQGEKDGDLTPSEAIYTALERLGKPVEYRLYQGEGHALTQTANVRDFVERRFAFLAEHLGLTYDAKGAIKRE